jgi:hypothetical protein
MTTENMPKKSSGTAKYIGTDVEKLNQVSGILSYIAARLTAEKFGRSFPKRNLEWFATYHDHPRHHIGADAPGQGYSM